MAAIKTIAVDPDTEAAQDWIDDKVKEISDLKGGGRTSKGSILNLLILKEMYYVEQRDDQLGLVDFVKAVNEAMTQTEEEERKRAAARRQEAMQSALSSV